MTSFRSEESFTRDEFMRWLERLPPSDINHYELVRGQIVMCPPAIWVHGSVEMRVARHIDEYVTQHDLGVVFGSSTGIDLPSGDTLQPDCSFVSHQRLLDQPRAPTKLFLKVVPNLIVEILSDSTAQRDRTEKKALYEQNGVDEYWLVDPVRRRITVFALSANGYGSGVTYASGDVCSQVLAGLRIPLAEVFRLLDAAPRR